MVLQNMFCCKNDAIAFYNELTESNAKQFFINKENRYPLSKSVQANLEGLFKTSDLKVVID